MCIPLGVRKYVPLLGKSTRKNQPRKNVPRKNCPLGKFSSEKKPPVKTLIFLTIYGSSVAYDEGSTVGVPKIPQ